MQTISKYKVVRVGLDHVEAFHRFEIEVNEKLNAGWMFHGTTFTLPIFPLGTFLFQAMETKSQYKTVHCLMSSNNFDEDFRKFEIEVGEKLNDDWKLHGTPLTLSLNITEKPYRKILCQVMVK